MERISEERDKDPQPPTAGRSNTSGRLRLLSMEQIAQNLETSADVKKQAIADYYERRYQAGEMTMLQVLENFADQQQFGVSWDETD